MEEAKKTTIRKGENDKVDTDFLVRQAKAKYALWKAHNKKLKKQYLELAEEVFNKISEGILNGTFTYNSLENGFNNFSGVVNLDDGIDIPGRIANIWTESLNLSPLHIDPTKVQEALEIVELPVTEEESSPAVLEVDETPKQPVYRDENEWRMAVYPRSSETNLLNYTINRKILTSLREQFKFLQLCINKLNEKELFKMIEIGLTYPEKPIKGKNLNYIDKIVKPFVEKYKGVSKFSNSLILYTAIEIARQKNLLHQFNPNDNRYYIPLNIEGYKKRRTGLVFQISLDGKHKLIEMDRNDIPYFTNQWHDEYLKLYPSHKNGGIIKALQGWRTPLAPDVDENKVALDPKLWNGAYGKFEDILKRWLSSDNYKNLNADTFLKSLNNLESDDFKNLKWNNDEGNPEFDYINKKWARGYSNWNQAFNNTGLNSIFGYNKDKEDLLGLTTYNRKLFLDELKKTYTQNTWLDVGGQKIQWDGDKNQWIKFTPVISTTKTSAKLNSTELDSNSDSLFVKSTTDPFEAVDFRNSSWKDKLMANWDQIIAGIRLPLALHNNEEVTKVGLKALKPVLEEAPYVHRYEEGSFDLESFANSNASDTEYKAKHSNLTSDSHLTSALILEGLRMGNEMRKQGFLLGNQEWKRSREASWQQEKENVQNAVQTTNRNRASINMTNKERAQLITQKLRANWQSWDNFLQGIQTRLREDHKEYNTIQNSFKTLLAEKQAERWLSKAIEKAEAAKDRELARQKAAGITPDITSWNGYERYKKHITDAQAMYEAMRYRDFGRIYNIPYNIPYTDEEFMTFIDSWID